MRVLTTTLPVASQPAQLYASCDADATACLVVHKAFETAADRGAMAARQMLFDCEPACGLGVVLCSDHACHLRWEGWGSMLISLTSFATPGCTIAM